MVKKLIFVIIICTAHILFRVLDKHHSRLKENFFSSTKEKYPVDSEKVKAVFDELRNNNFEKMLNNVYMNYDHHRVNAVEKFIVNSLKKEKEEIWVFLLIDRMTKLVEADLKNEFYIKLLKEIHKYKVNDSYFSEDKIEDIIYQLEQLYANRIQGPSSWIIKETDIEVAPVYTTSYRLEYLETFRAEMNDFAEFEKDAEAYWRILSTFCINYTSKNIINAIMFLENDIKEYPVRTNQTASILINALISRLEYLTEADLKNECYVELLKVMHRKKMIGTYSQYEIDDIIDRLEETYADKNQKPSLWTQTKRNISKLKYSIIKKMKYYTLLGLILIFLFLIFF